MTKEIKTWRLVETDNFGGDYPNERFLAVGIDDEETARLLAHAWNAKWCSHDGCDRFCKVVEHVECAYVLAGPFEP